MLGNKTAYNKRKKRSLIIMGTVVLALLLMTVRKSESALTFTESVMWTEYDFNQRSKEYESFGDVLATGDFDNDGYDDLAIGVPREGLPYTDDQGFYHARTQAGIVVIYYGGKNPNKIFKQGSDGVSGMPEDGDRFGWALAVGDFDGDYYDDLAIGVPYEDYNGKDAGTVNILYGSKDGLTGNHDHKKAWSQIDLEDCGPEKYDGFGYALAAGDFNGDFVDDLAVGVPGEDVKNNTILDAGMVNVIYGRRGSGLIASGSQLWHQTNLLHKYTKAEQFDKFGQTLAAGDFDGDSVDDLAVGVPFEDYTYTDIGEVDVIYGKKYVGLTADRCQVLVEPFRLSSSARFGQSLAVGNFGRDWADDLAIGAPGYDWGEYQNIGLVAVHYGEMGYGFKGSAQLLNPALHFCGERGEANDEFGYSLAAFNPHFYSYDDLFDDLVVGVPGDNSAFMWPYWPIGTNSGSVRIFRSYKDGITSTGCEILRQNGAIKDWPENYERFGSSLAVGDFNNNGREDLAVGVPGEIVSYVPGRFSSGIYEGAVDIIYDIYY